MENEDKNTQKTEENTTPRSHKLIAVLAILFVVLAILFVAFLFFLKNSDVKISSLFESPDDSSSALVPEVAIGQNGATEKTTRVMEQPLRNENQVDEKDFTNNMPKASKENSIDPYKKELRMIMSAMNNNRGTATVCRDHGGTILSGSALEEICSVPILNGINTIWITPTLCGDAQWTVFNGNTGQWDFTVECKNFTECNGPSGAICNAQGCIFHCAEGESDSDGATIVEIDL